MDIVKSVKNIGSEVEKGVDTLSEKATEIFDNLASHLPFANLAKKEDNSFHVEIDFPGVKKEDINIKVEDGMLVASAVRSFKNELSRDDYHVCESVFGKIERRFALPENIDAENIDAEYKNGRLEIELKKVSAAQPKSISIK